MAARVVGELAAAVDPGLAAWIDANVSFVTTMVDRITPRTTDDDRGRLRAETGVDDPLPVVTEPYVEWVLAGEFPHGRPRWEDAGARFVDDIEPWEQRKLWLLNGSHSLMAYAGTDPRTRDRRPGDRRPDRAGPGSSSGGTTPPAHLPLPADEIAAYRAALLERFANPRIRHLLAQIAADGSQKLPIRILPTVRGRAGRGAGAGGRRARARRLGVPPARARRAGGRRRRGRDRRAGLRRPRRRGRRGCWTASASTTGRSAPPQPRWPTSSTGRPRTDQAPSTTLRQGGSPCQMSRTGRTSRTALVRRS